MHYKSKAYTIFTIFNTMFMILVLMVCLLPYMNVVAIAFNEGVDTMLGGVTFIPRTFTLENFKTILGESIIYNAALVSIFRVAAGTLATLTVTYCLAYAFRKKKFAGRTAFMVFFMMPQFFSAGLIATYILYSRLHLLGNPLLYILPYAYNFFYMVVMRTYISTAIPGSIEESAKIDGASDFIVMLKLFVPLSKPIIATIGIYAAVFHWNDWTTTLYYLQKESNFYTLQYVLMQVLRESQRLAQIIIQNAMNGIYATKAPQITPESIQNAQIVLTTVPIIVVYPFLQKYFIKGIVVGAIKE